MKSTAIIVALMLACLGIGFFGGTRIELSKAKRTLAIRTFSQFRMIGAANPEDIALWKQELTPELNEALAVPWAPLEQDDDLWGDAYYVLKDRGAKTWAYHDGMTQAGQDEMIRYLSYRIQLAAQTNCSRGLEEFKALLTYPENAVTRNKEKVSHAVLSAASSDFGEIRHTTFAYVAQVTDLDWGRELCWLCIQRAAYKQGVNRVTWIMNCVHDNAQGKQGIAASILNLGKPSREAQEGALKVEAEFVRASWSAVDDGTMAVIEKWKHRLGTATSAAVSQ